MSSSIKFYGGDSCKQNERLHSAELNQGSATDTKLDGFGIANVISLQLKGKAYTL